MSDYKQYYTSDIASLNYTYKTSGKYKVQLSGMSALALNTNSNYSRNTKLTDVRFNSSISAIPANAFYNCTNLSSVSKASNLTSVGAYAFYNCSKLSSVGMKNLVSINYDSFYNCNKLSSLYVDNSARHSIYNNQVITDRSDYTLYYVVPGCNALSTNTVQVFPQYCASYSNISSLITDNFIWTMDQFCFSDTYKLQYIHLKERVQNIFYRAFCYSYVQEVHMPKQPNFSSWQTFMRCSRLSCIDLPVMTSTGGGAFSYCTSLISAYFPVLPYITWSTFQGCSKLQDLSVPMLTGYSSTVGDNTFNGSNRLSCMYVNNDTLHSIGNGYGDGQHQVVVTNDEHTLIKAVNAMTRISNDNIYDIGIGGMLWCTSLTSVNLRNLSSIGQQGFYSDILLNVIDLPKIQTINSQAFDSCSKLENIVIGSEDSQTIATLANVNAFQNIPGSYKISVPPHLYQNYLTATNWSTIASHIDYNRDYSYQLSDMIIKVEDCVYDAKKTEYTPVPEVKGTTKVLQNNIDFTCTYRNNTSVGIATCIITGIGQYTGTVEKNFEIYFFAGTIYQISTSNSFTIYSALPLDTSLSTNIDWGDGSSTLVLGRISNKYHTYANAGEYKVTLDDTLYSIAGSSSTSIQQPIQSVRLGSKLTQIGSYMFYGASNLKQISFQNTNISSIGNNAFRECRSLSSIDVGDKLASIGNNAFQYCSSLSSIDLGDNLTSIGDTAFYNCSALTELSFGDKLTYIGSSAFSYCTLLSSMTLSSRLTSLGSYAFSGCSNLKEVDLSEARISSIQQYTFQYCTSLDTVRCCQTLTSIASHSFYGSYIKHIDLSETNIVSLQSYSFTYSPLLSSIELSPRLSSIAMYSFQSCSSLEKLFIPKNVKIVTRAYDYCSHLKLITFLDHEFVPTLSYASTFSKIESDYKIVVPANLLAEWKAKTNWNTIQSHICTTSYDVNDAVYFYMQYIPLNKAKYVTANPRIYDGTYQLVENQDFTIQYFNNTDVGTASFTVTGIGNYNGTSTHQFQISPSINDSFLLDCENYYPKSEFGDIYLRKRSEYIYDAKVNWDNGEQDDEFIDGSYYSWLMIWTDGEKWYIYEVDGIAENGELTIDYTYIDTEISEQTLFSKKQFTVIDIYDEPHKFTYINED